MLTNQKWWDGAKHSWPISFLGKPTTVLRTATENVSKITTHRDRKLRIQYGP